MMGGIYANENSRFEIDPADLLGRRCLLYRDAVRKEGTTDRRRVNDGVNARDGE